MISVLEEDGKPGFDHHLGLCWQYGDSVGKVSIKKKNYKVEN